MNDKTYTPTGAIEQLYIAAGPLIDHAKKTPEGRKALYLWDIRRPNKVFEDG